MLARAPLSNIHLVSDLRQDAPAIFDGTISCKPKLLRSVTHLSNGSLHVQGIAALELVISLPPVLPVKMAAYIRGRRPHASRQQSA